MRKKRIMIWVVSIISLFAIFAVGCKGRFTVEKKVNWIVDKMVDDLDLSDNQEAKLEQIKKEVIAKIKETKGKRKAVFNELISQIKSDRIDQEKIYEMFEEAHTKNANNRKYFIAKASEFHSILSAKQRMELVNKMQELYKKFHH